MDILHPVKFEASVLAAKENFVAISEIIGKHLGKESQTDFMTACTNDDSANANGILEELVKKLIGGSSVDSALIIFSEKFDKYLPELNEKIMNANFENDKIEILASYYDKLSSLLSQEQKIK